MSDWTFVSSCRRDTPSGSVEIRRGIDAWEIFVLMNEGRWETARLSNKSNFEDAMRFASRIVKEMEAAPPTEREVIRVEDEN
jgi:hypothetical protein